MNLDRRIGRVGFLNQISKRVKIRVDIARFRFDQAIVISIAALPDLRKNRVKVCRLCVLNKLIDLPRSFNSRAPGIDPNSPKLFLLSFSVELTRTQKNAQQQKVPDAESVGFHSGSFG